MNLNERFEDKYVINPDTGCWDWTACKDKDGYGNISINGATVRAHRVSYEMYYTRISSEILVCHSCDNPSCVNPEHLFLGTHQDNMDDKIRKGRTNPVKGQDHPSATLSNLQVSLIKCCIADGKDNHHIASIFKTSHRVISKIRTGETWKHIK